LDASWNWKYVHATNPHRAAALRRATTNRRRTMVRTCLDGVLDGLFGSDSPAR
jgi:hypothetical protein